MTRTTAALALRIACPYCASAPDHPCVATQTDGSLREIKVPHTKRSNLAVWQRAIGALS